MLLAEISNYFMEVLMHASNQSGFTVEVVNVNAHRRVETLVPRLRDVQFAARHADPRTTTIFDRRRENFDRHAAYVVIAFVAGS